MTLGEVQRLVGKHTEAEASVQEAIALYEAKGIVPFVVDARARLGDLRDV